VTFPGALTQDQVASALAAADVVAVPSVRDDAGNVDGLPNIVLEGLASGTPVVATPAGGISTVARDGMTACVVAERDPRGLAKAIDGLLRDPALRTRLGTAARAAIRESHTWSDVAEQFETQGSERFSHTYGMAASRIPFLVKDPRGWDEFRRMLGEHSPEGSAHTMRGVQAGRPSLYDLEDALSRITAPTLVVVGDEDDHCLNPGIFLKRVIPACGLYVLPKTGHALNLEEPDMTNRAIAEFLAQAAAGRWQPRDPRADPNEIIRTK